MAKEHQTERTVHVTIEETSGFGVKAQLNGETWRIGKKDFAGKASIDREIEETGDDLPRKDTQWSTFKRMKKLLAVLALRIKSDLKPKNDSRTK